MTQRTCLRRIIVATMVVLFAASSARADIFQWEYIDPADPSQGKRQSTTLAAEGAGVDAVPGADLSGRNLTMAYLTGASLSDSGYGCLTGYGCGTWIRAANLAGTNLTAADLTYANLIGAILIDADFTGSDVRGAQFGTVSANTIFGPVTYGTGITLAQLYLTTSYQTHDLTGIALADHDLTRANFAGQNLTNAHFYGATLRGADFRQANLANSDFSSATLSDADFTNAEVRGGGFYNFDGTGITLEQLYSTASYQARELAGIGLGGNKLGGGKFAGQNLTDANFNGATLIGGDFRQANLSNAYLDTTWMTDADFREANLTNASLYAATLTNADFTGAEIRGASFFRDISYHPASGVTLAQLYSTASYQARDLSGIGLAWNELIDGNFAGQNLTNASFYYATLTRADFRGAKLTNADFNSATLTDADFAGAEVRGAGLHAITLAQLYSTASYQAHDLTGISIYGVYGDLSRGDFAGQNLANANFSYATLTGADFSNANLASANFEGATLTDADFTGTDVRGAHFYNFNGTGITLAQLYSTASYQAHDLSGVNLYGNNLARGNFAGQNLSNALFGTLSRLNGATLTSANFSEANLANASFGPSDLSGANFRLANLANASFSYVAGHTCVLTGDSCYPNFAGATLTDADFTRAVIRGASFYRGYDYSARMYVGGITLAQLYSTASYQARDLSGVALGGNDLASGNFAGQNLTNTNFVDATLTGADFTAADARGAAGLYLDYLDGATTTNLIRPDGHIAGLDLNSGGLILIRDHDGNPRDYFRDPVPPIPIPITVDEHMTIGPGGTLRMVFEADAWDSTISFAPGIQVALGGTLELAFAADVNLATQVGRTFDLFDWTGVNPTGAFAISSRYAWDLSNLYTTGEVTLTAIPEPRTLLLFSVVLAALVAIGRVRHSINSSIEENQ